jgi:damage-control phosphatase, subfamily I
MNTTLDCIPCLVRQALDLAREASDDPAIHRRLMTDALHTAAALDYERPPPVVAQQMQRFLRSLTGIDDPYLEQKRRFHELAMRLLPEFRKRIETSDDPFVTALRTAIAGNVIDLGVHGGLTEAQAAAAMDRVLHDPFDGDPGEVRDLIRGAGRILYLADNAGEIVFDRLLLDHFPANRTAVAVRGGPILNDALRADAEAAGIPEVAELLDNGDDAPGTILSQCGADFLRAYEAADLVVSKGQGNYETLSDEPKDILFLFKAKCPVIAEHADVPLGALVARRSAHRSG